MWLKLFLMMGNVQHTAAVLRSHYSKPELITSYQTKAQKYVTRVGHLVISNLSPSLEV